MPYMNYVCFDNVPAEILIPSGGMGRVWCCLNPLSTVIRKMTSCQINTEKNQKLTQRMTAVVGTNNSLNTALAIKFLTQLKSLHKNYTNLWCEILCQLLIHISVPNQEIQLPSPNPVSPEEHGGSGLCWNAQQGRMELMPAAVRCAYLECLSKSCSFMDDFLR